MIVLEAPIKISEVNFSSAEQERIASLRAQRHVAARIIEVQEKCDPDVEERRVKKKAEIEKQVADMLDGKGAPQPQRVSGADASGKYVDFIADGRATEWVEYAQDGSQPIQIRLVEELTPRADNVAIVNKVYIKGRPMGGDEIPRALFHIGISNDDKRVFYVSHDSEEWLDTISTMLEDADRDLQPAAMPEGFVPSDSRVLRPIGTMLTHVLQEPLQLPQ